jgi:protein SCO1
VRRDRTWRVLAVALTAVLALLAGACGDDGGDGGAAFEGITRDDPLQVGTVSLPEVAPGQPEREFTFRAAAPGELLAVYFGYTTCPDLCPATLADVRNALAQLGPDAERVSVALVTVDPERDTPEVMARYLGSFVERGHTLRTEDPDALAAAEAAFGASHTISVDDAGRIEVAHTSITYVVDHTGAVLVEWPFGVDGEAMAHDLRLLFTQMDDPT